MLNKISNESKVRSIQATLYAAVISVLIFHWDTGLFFIGLGLGWLLWLFGVSLSLHKWSCHKSYTPNNIVYKVILLWIGSMCLLGSNISWSIGHRFHHKYSDSKGDPFRPKGKLFHKIKRWFYYFDQVKVSPWTGKDLMNDPLHCWFHKYYFAVVGATLVPLFLYSPLHFCYLVALPIVYVLSGFGWITVIAHTPFFSQWSYRTYNTNDYTFNSHFWELIFAGEGHHNTHHHCPHLWNTAISKGEWDTSAQIIKLIGSTPERKIPEHPPIRTGKALVDEIQSVVKFINDEDTAADTQFRGVENA